MGQLINSIYFIVDTSCKMALMHQAFILYFEMIRHACISKPFFLLFWLVGHDFYSELLKLMSKWPDNSSVMHGSIYNSVLRLFQILSIWFNPQ